MRAQTCSVHLASLATKTNHRRRHGLRRKQQALRYKIRNWIDDVQWKTIRWMCSKHTAVLVGKLPVKSLSAKAKRNLRPKAVRMLYAWGHYRFQQRLLSKAEELCCEARLVNESWTSKTCTACGMRNHGLGSSKTFCCPRTSWREELCWTGT